MKLFFKLLSKPRSWEEVLDVLIDNETDDVCFPVIIFHDNIDWEFQVFSKPKDLIEASINGHWGLSLDFRKTQNNSLVDALGRIYKLEDNIKCEGINYKYSYPRDYIGDMSLLKLKCKMIDGLHKVLDFTVDHNEIIKTIVQVKKGKEFLEVLNSARSNGF
jgi:hypothetical protein